jgi:hypothetical protein
MRTKLTILLLLTVRIWAAPLPTIPGAFGHDEHDSLPTHNDHGLDPPPPSYQPPWAHSCPSHGQPEPSHDYPPPRYSEAVGPPAPGLSTAFIPSDQRRSRMSPQAWSLISYLGVGGIGCCIAGSIYCAATNK